MRIGKRWYYYELLNINPELLTRYTEKKRGRIIKALVKDGVLHPDGTVKKAGDLINWSEMVNTERLEE